MKNIELYIAYIKLFTNECFLFYEEYIKNYLQNIIVGIISTNLILTKFILNFIRIHIYINDFKFVFGELDGNENKKKNSTEFRGLLKMTGMRTDDS